MKQTTTLLIAILLAGFCHGQKLVTSYYDYNKIHPHEQYYVNAAGQKTGLYKEYNQNGVVTTECTYQNDLANGVCTTYWAKANNQRSIGAKGTYKNGVLDGPSVSYDISGVPLEQGNYVNGVKEGKWTVIAPLDDPDIEHPAEGFKYLKSVMDLKNGEVADGLVKVTYYPSGKPFREFYMKNGKESGEQTAYYPDGKLKSKDRLDATKVYFTTRESYYSSGKLESYKEYGDVSGNDNFGNPIRFLWSEERYENGKLKGYQNIEGDLFEVDESGQPTAYMRNNNIALSWNRAKFDEEFKLAGQLQNQLDNTLRHNAAYYIPLIDSLKAANQGEQAYQLAKQVVFAYPGDEALRLKYQVVKASTPSVIAEGFYKKGLGYYRDKQNDSATVYFGNYIAAVASGGTPDKIKLCNAYSLIGWSWYYKDKEKAKSYYAKAIEANPQDNGAPYNLACLYALENNKADALKYIELSIKNGYKNIAHIKDDADLSLIRNSDELTAIINKYSN